MSFKVESNRKEHVLIEPGMHVARIFQVIDIGFVKDDRYKTNNRKVILGFELLEPNDFLTEGDNAGKSLVISKEYNITANSGSSCLGSERSTIFNQILKIVSPGLSTNEYFEYDLADLIGKELYLDISQRNKVSKPNEKKNVIDGTSKLPKGVKAHPAVHKPLVFNLDKYTEAQLKQIPKWILDFKLKDKLNKDFNEEDLEI